jgi:hypothetical protein
MQAQDLGMTYLPKDIQTASEKKWQEWMKSHTVLEIQLKIF